MTDGKPVPGDTRPRTLPKALPNPPGDRYAPRTPGATPATPWRAAGTTATRPNLVRGVLFAIVAAAVVALVIALLIGILDIGVGLLAIVAVGGWVIGVSTRAGAWPGGVARPSAGVRGLAIACAAGSWVCGYFGAYLVSLLIRPDSYLSFGQRLAQSPFLDWLSPQFSALQIVELLLLTGIAWYSSRSSWQS